MHTKKKVIIIVSMVVLLAVTAYVNIMLNRNVDQPIDKPNIDEPVSQFVSMRINRETSRVATMTYLDGIIASPTSSAEAKTNAETLKMNLIKSIEIETKVEGLIKAKGYDDAIIKLSDTNIQVVVAKDGLQANEVGQILEIVTTSTEYTTGQVIISSKSYI